MKYTQNRLAHLVFRGLIILSGCLYGTAGLTQNIKSDYGNIKIADFSLSKVEVDTLSEAIIMLNSGDVRFRVNNEGDDLEYVYTRHVKIRILNKRGLDWANHSLLLYRSGVNTEKIVDIRASTYNLVNGEILREKLKNNAVFEEELNNNFKQISFALPDAHEGSIIEYTYTIYSPFLYHLPSWQFQYPIPVCKSELSVLLPEFFEYKFDIKGYLPLEPPVQQQYNETFIFKYATLPQTGGLVEHYKVPVESYSWWKIWKMNNIPAFREEPFSNHPVNYMTSLSFELAALRLPNSPIKYYNVDWETLNKRLLEDEDFGRQLKGGRFLSDLVTELKSFQGTKNQLFNLAVQKLKSRVKWNGRTGIYTVRGLKSAYNDGIGNVAEMNLLLVLLLRELGVEAHPVVLSTRSNGLLMPGVAKLTQLNYVIAHIRDGDKEFLADISQPDCPVGVLSQEVINGNGVMVAPGPAQMIDLSLNAFSGELRTCSFALDLQGKITGTISEKYQKTAASEKRTQVKKLKAVKIFEEIQTRNPNFDFEDFTVLNPDSLHQPLLISYKASYESGFTDGQLIIDPFLLDTEKENPFQLEERQYPIDFVCPREETYTFSLSLPEGYQVSEKPEPITMLNSDNSAQFTLVCNELGGTIQVISKIKYGRAVYVPSEYKDIKEFARQISLKKNQKIILKKA